MGTAYRQLNVWWVVRLLACTLLKHMLDTAMPHPQPFHITGCSQAAQASAAGAPEGAGTPHMHCAAADYNAVVEGPVLRVWLLWASCPPRSAWPTSSLCGRCITLLLLQTTNACVDMFHVAGAVQVSFPPLSAWPT